MVKKKTLKLNNALFELGLEEVPARFIPGMLDDLKVKTEKVLQDTQLSFRSIQTYGTPRRIVLYLEGLPEKQKDILREIKGPVKEVAFMENGQPTKAAEGFAKSHGLTVSDLKLKKVGKKEFIFAYYYEKGLEIRKYLEKHIPKIVRSLYLPISMKWADVDLRFVRPIHWIFAVCEKKILDIEIGKIKSSNKTYGHRFFAPKPIVLSASKGIDINIFKKALLKGKVILDQEERKKKIVNLIRSSTKKLNGEALIDKDLLEEVTHLVEWPEPLTGNLKREYLELPKDVLVTTMKKNQKYFSVVDARGSLLPNFICITNGLEKANLKRVREGNENVLSARLEDARFFFQEDRKGFLADLVPKLKNVAFYEKLGTIFEKTERITALSEWIAKELKLSESQKDNIEKIAKLCKADLLTQMVCEFPELQGIMGREYILLEGKSKTIANGICEHYLPRHADDDLPSSVEGAVVGLADRIDSIVGCFGIDLIPTGSADPYALRRQAAGIVSVLLSMKVNLGLDLLIERSYKLYKGLFESEAFRSGKIKLNKVEKVIPDVLSFIATRVKNILLEEKIKYDVADSVLSKFEDVLDSYQKAKAINDYLKEDMLKGIVFTADRITRLAVNAKRENVVESDFVQNEEKEIHGKYLKINFEMGQALEKNDYKAALLELAKMTKPVDDFFVKVMVMDKDEKLRSNRLALLKTLERMYLEVADFPKIVM